MHVQENMESVSERYKVQGALNAGTKTVQKYGLVTML